jgi:DNA-binding NarL/FixJ family response regulator
MEEPLYTVKALIVPSSGRVRVRCITVKSVNGREPLAAKTNVANATSARQEKRAILLVEDHPLFRKGMADLLSTEPDLEVAGQAENSGGALDAILSKRLDLVVLDIRLKGDMDGIELAKIIHLERPELPILIVSMYDEAIYVERALRSGARGYVTKSEALDRILDGVRDLLNGKIYICPTMVKKMPFTHFDSQGKARSAVERLTDRELEVFQLIGEGHDMGKIASRLGVSKTAAEGHRANIKGKLAVATSRELVRYAALWVRQHLELFARGLPS